MVKKASAYTWDFHWHKLEELFLPALPTTINEYRKLFSQMIEISTLKLVIETGAGAGTTIIPFIEGGCKSILLDISPEALKVAMRFLLVLDLKDEAHFVVGDALHMPFRDDCADLIFNQGLLEHFTPEESVKILKEMKRTGKTIMVLVPNKINFGYQLAKFLCKVLRRPWPFGEAIERDYTEKILVEELWRANLKPTLIKKWGRTWALKHLLTIISSNPALTQTLGKSPIVEMLGYMLAKTLSVLTFSKDQIVACSCSSKGTEHIAAGKRC